MIEIQEYQGHIRNWKALCQELAIDAVSLTREERESEILLKAYQAWGDDMAVHMHGSYAFVIWDEEEQKLFCLRDPFGTRSLYYYETEDGMLRCSISLRKLLEMPGVKKEFNSDMLQIYMSLTYPAGENTFFRGVKKLMPGRTLTWQNGSIDIRRYWKPEFHPDETKTLDDWAAEIHAQVQHIMQEMEEEGERSESFLSSGVDSAYVLAMSKATASDSVGYDDSHLDESALAAATSEYLNCKNNRCCITPEMYFEVVPYVMENMEQPLGDASAIAFAIGCRETAKHTRLCYSGEGADEFFGGYNMYRNAERYGENLKTFYVGNTNIMKEEEKEKLLKNYNPEVLPIHLAKDIYAENEGLDPLSKMSDIDIQIWLEGDIYLNIEKMSAAAGFEVRMPLTDRRIFDIASRMPSRFKVNEEQNKVAFRTAAAKAIPEEVAFRKKLGFVVPIRYWLADSRYNEDVRRKLTSETAAKFFNMDVLNAIFEEYIGGNSDLWRKIWTVYTFLVWYEIYFN